MYLKKLVLINFKNIAQAEITLSERLNCFVGDNGAARCRLLPLDVEVGPYDD